MDPEQTQQVVEAAISDIQEHGKVTSETIERLETEKVLPTPPPRQINPTLRPCDKAPKHFPKLRRLTTHQLHRYLGHRQLKKWKEIELIADDVKVADHGEIPVEFGDVVNISRARRNKEPVPRPESYLDSVHMDIGYGDCESVGGFRYVLLLVDRTTRNAWVYGLKTLSQDLIVQALEKFRLDAGALPKTLYTDFDKKLIAGTTEKWLTTNECKVLPAPPSHQDQNGLVERTWRTVVAMARSYITEMQMPRTFWFWAIRHATLCHNYIPCKVNDELTTPLELAYGEKPKYSTLFRLFSTIYFKKDRDGSRDRDGVESKSMQGIALGRSEKTNGYIAYCPHTKQFYDTVDFKLDEGRDTATAFGLKYDGGLFFGLYDGPCIPQGTEPYPEGTPVVYKADNGTHTRGYVTSTPKSHRLREVPENSRMLALTPFALLMKRL